MAIPMHIYQTARLRMKSDEIDTKRPVRHLAAYENRYRVEQTMQSETILGLADKIFAETVQLTSRFKAHLISRT